MAYITGAGVGADTPLKKALTQPTSWEDLSKQVNSDLLKYDSMGVKPDANVLANGGLTTNDYNNMVGSLKPQVTPTVTTPTTPTTVKDALVSSTPTYAKAPDNSGMINDSYSSLISALKAQIQQRQNDKQLQLNNVGQIYDPQRATSEVRKNSELRSVLEQNINAGDRGGVGRQNALITQTEGDNRLNAINLQQTNDENSLKNDIANLVLEGNVQEAQLKSQQLKDLIANNQYVDETNYNRSTNADNTGYSRLRDALSDKANADNTAYARNQDTFNNNLKLADILGTYNGNQTIQGRQADATYNSTILENEARAIANQYAPQIAQGTIDGNALSNAYQTMVNANYTKEESAKIAQILAQTTGIQLDNNAQTIANKYAPQIAQGQIDGQKLQNAYQRLVNAGYSATTAADLAAKYANIAQGNAQVDISRQNANTNAAELAWRKDPTNPDNIKTPTATSYKNDPSFQTTYAAAIKDPATSLTKLKADPQKFITAFGLDGFKALYTAASPKSSAIDFSFLNGLE